MNLCLAAIDADHAVSVWRMCPKPAKTSVGRTRRARCQPLGRRHSNDSVGGGAGAVSIRRRLISAGPAAAEVIGVRHRLKVVRPNAVSKAATAGGNMIYLMTIGDWPYESLVREAMHPSEFACRG
jgi:hypothetical protein